MNTTHTNTDIQLQIETSRCGGNSLNNIANFMLSHGNGIALRTRADQGIDAPSASVIRSVPASHLMRPGRNVEARPIGDEAVGFPAESSPPLRSISPFRYPGGKAFLCRYLIQRLALLPSGARYYAEPFCGGAGAALLLLKLGAVDEIHLNDADPKIYSAWKYILEEPERFSEKIFTTPVDLHTWHTSREIVERSTEISFELGFATFFLNRTSRSGIVIGAGPIGGYDQRGNWKIDARFNRPALAARVRWLGSARQSIQLTQEDALTFISRSRERLNTERTLFFVDPPYVSAGGRLYLNAMNEAKHVALSDMLQNGSLAHWVLTYDDHPLIRSLYSERIINGLNVSYSLQNKRRETEVLINNQTA